MNSEIDASLNRRRFRPMALTREQMTLYYCISLFNLIIYLALQMSLRVNNNGDILDSRGDSTSRHFSYSNVPLSDAWNFTSERSSSSLLQGM